MGITSEQVRHVQLGSIELEIHPNRQSMGIAAAQATAEAMKELAAFHDTFGVIFATGASQLATLEALTAMQGLPWDQIRGFHLDEYVGLPIEHLASFRGYLRKNLTEKVKMKEFFEVNGTAPDLDQACQSYAEKLREVNPQLCLLGIGENGHLAFNDPGIADFSDPLDVKVVPLDAACRQQQTAEGWFKSPQEVPDNAITLTVPAILRVPKLIVSVPGIRKAAIMRRTLEEAISTDCPATILRIHPGTTIFLDDESSSELDGLIPLL